jgi:phospholipid transport system transporter-binding protein
MIEMNADGVRVSGPMLNTNASALLLAGRGFLSSLVGSAELVVDLSAVEETDSSALGVVFGWLRSAREKGVSLRVVNPPASMMSLAALYGVSEALPLA